MDILKLLIDHLLSWPVAAAVICVLLRKSMIRLLGEFSDLLKRSNRVSVKHGDMAIEAGVDTPVQERDVEKPKDLALGAGNSLAEPTVQIDQDKIQQARRNLREYASGLVTVPMREGLIRNELSALGFMIPDDDLTSILIRQIAGAQSSSNFEKTYRLIFGSQVASLEYLNRNGPQSTAILRMFFEMARSENPDFYSEKTFESWLAFLFSSLITTDGQDVSETFEDQIYGISNLGRDFLVWIVYEGLSTRRAF
jgi:hypothetical protein